MNPREDRPCALILSGFRRLFPLLLLLSASLNSPADALPTTLHIHNNGHDLEGFQTVLIEWEAISNATYLVQSADSLAPGSASQTLDALQFRVVT